MKKQVMEQRLELIEAALGHFYHIDTQTLLDRYRRHLEALEKPQGPPISGDREAAIAYFQTIPDRCAENRPLEMKQEMLKALSEADLLTLCDEQARLHPALQGEIRSMFDFCLKVKRLL